MEGSPSAQAERGTCTACRGTGRLISNLGGQPHEVKCPWCDGTGTFIAEHDAQEAPAEQAAPVSTGAPASTEQ